MKRIIIDHGEGKRMAKTFRVTVQTVCHAMRFTSNSELQVKLRTYAMKNGGKLIEY